MKQTQKHINKKVLFLKEINDYIYCKELWLKFFKTGIYEKKYLFNKQKNDKKKFILILRICGLILLLLGFYALVLKK